MHVTKHYFFPIEKTFINVRLQLANYLSVNFESSWSDKTKMVLKIHEAATHKGHKRETNLFLYV